MIFLPCIAGAQIKLCDTSWHCIKLMQTGTKSGCYESVIISVQRPRVSESFRMPDLYQLIVNPSAISNPSGVCQAYVIEDCQLFIQSIFVGGVQKQKQQRLLHFISREVNRSRIQQSWIVILPVWVQLHWYKFFWRSSPQENSSLLAISFEQHWWWLIYWQNAAPKCL